MEGNIIQEEGASLKTSQQQRVVGVSLNYDPQI